jgi:hypothetical protein
VLRRIAKQGRDILAETLRLLPISSRIVGPPKGFYGSFEQYTRKVREGSANEWRVLAPESRRLFPPGNLQPEETAMFQPLNHESSGFNFYRMAHGRFHRDARAILTRDDRILAPFSAHMGSGPSDNWLFRRMMLGRLTRVPGKSLLLVGNRNYYHFLIEELPRVWLARQAGFEIGQLDHIVMFSPAHESQRTLCKRLEIDENKIVPLERFPHVECEELYFTTGPWNYGAAYLQKAREFLLGLARSSSIQVMKRIYISRERCSHGKITNEVNLLIALNALGFEKVIPDTLSYDDQVALFAEAEVIVGAHGAGLTNLIFSQPHCKLVEIRNPTYHQSETYQARGGNIFWRFSQFLDFDYHAFFAKPDETDYRAPDGQVVEMLRLPNLTVDIDAFVRFLKPILESQGLPAVAFRPPRKSDP